MNNLILGMIGVWEIGIILLMLLVMAGLAVGVVWLVIWLVRRNQTPPSPPANSTRPQQTPPPTSAACPRCGATLPPDSPQGLCPRCVLGVGLATQTEATGEFGPHGTKLVPPPEAEVAKRFPHLEILGCLGHGGMGVVYKARQPKLNRLVALKILAPEKGADPKFAERFLREAQALARLSHPNIVTVHDFGEADGMFFLLMEFVDGMTLRQLLREGRMKPEEALAIVPPICEALQFAHEQGVVHRDIKPENVLLDKQGRVKIADFGIAKLVAVAGQPLSPSDGERVSERTGEGTLTQDHIIGTPHYMAPEQVEHPQTVDHRADIYSLGVVFYEMLTGELPLGKFQPPSKKVQVDVRLDEVVLHALEKEPERRYQKASQVKTDVEAIATTPSSGSRGRESAPSEDQSRLTSAATIHSMVKAPGNWLVATGILNWIAIPLVVFVTAGIVAGKGGSVWPAPVLLVSLSVFFLSSLIIVAGLKMKRLEAYPLAIIGSILAILVTPGNIIGLPVGIWCLVVLCRREVRKAFGRKLPPDLLASGAATAAPVSRPDRFWRRFAVVIALVLLALILIPAGLILLSITLPALNRAKVKMQQPVAAEAVVRAEEKLRREIVQRLADDGWKAEGLSVSVSPNLRRAECSFGTVWKNGLASEPPPRAAIYLEPQGGGLWLVRGEGEFQALRFSVDTSTEMAATSTLDGQMGKDSEAGPPVEIVAQFGPETETTLNDIDDYRGSDLLDLDAAKTLNLNRDFEKWPREQQAQWLKDNGVDFMLDYVNRQWGLITPWGLESKLVAVANPLWDAMSAEQFERELSRTDPAVKRISRRDVTVYLLETNVAPPFTFVFQTASGTRGLLRITQFMEQPNSVRLQFKQGPGAISPKPGIRNFMFAPVTERVLPDPDNGGGRSNRETLHLQTGERVSVLDGAPKENGGRLRALVASEGDLFAEYDDFVSGRWAFVTAGLKLSDFLSRQWETATPGDVGEALKQPSALQRLEHSGATLYYLPDGLLPLTFAFESRTGERGLLQITGFTDNPRTVTIRYKLVTADTK